MARGLGPRTTSSQTVFFCGREGSEMKCTRATDVCLATDLGEMVIRWLLIFGKGKRMVVSALLMQRTKLFV